MGVGAGNYIYGSRTAGIIYVLETIIMNNANSAIKIERKGDISSSGNFKEKSQFQSFSGGLSDQASTGSLMAPPAWFISTTSLI